MRCGGTSKGCSRYRYLELTFEQLSERISAANGAIDIASAFASNDDLILLGSLPHTARSNCVCGELVGRSVCTIVGPLPYRRIEGFRRLERRGCRAVGGRASSVEPSSLASAGVWLDSCSAWYASIRQGSTNCLGWSQVRSGYPTQLTWYSKAGGGSAFDGRRPKIWSINHTSEPLTVALCSVSSWIRSLDCPEAAVPAGDGGGEGTEDTTGALPLYHWSGLREVC